MTEVPSMRALRYALADLDGEVVSLGGSRGVRIGRLVHHLAFGGADVSDDDIGIVLAGNRSERITRSGPAMLPAKAGKAIAIVSMYGVALPKFEMQPYAYSTFRLASKIEALADDPAVSAIVLDVDSPGGVVTGTPESSDAVFNARQRKLVIAFVNPLAASAAYWISASASQIVSMPSGESGSIGAFTIHLDQSKMLDSLGVKATILRNKQSQYKTELNSFEPLSADAKAYQERQLNAIGRAFINAVARGRGVSAAVVAADFGQGRVKRALDARRAGLIDRVGDFGDVLTFVMSPSAMRADRLAALRGGTSDRERAALTRRARLRELASD
jgi:signal peptide peptidase SppA